MPKSKKRKEDNSRLQKIEKAQHKNEFLLRLEKLCNDITGSNVFQLIPRDQLEDIYKLRNHPIRVIEGEGQKIPNDILQETKSMVLDVFKHRRVPLDIGNVSSISLYDFFTVGFTLMLYGTRINEVDFPGATEVKSKLNPLVSIADGPIYNSVWREYLTMMHLMSVVMSDLQLGLYALKHTKRELIKGHIGLFFCMEIYRAETEQIKFTLDGSSRPAFRLGWFLDENIGKIDFIKVESEKLNLPDGKTFDVYIQSHAFARLQERIDGVTPGFLHFSIYDSFKNLKVAKNKKGELLCEFALIDKKVGYFVGQILDGKLLLKTFLFLTNNGTPEGEKLHKHTGLMKEDKIYLSIDKFSSFINSDIVTNPIVKDIFIKAGCESLFKVDEAVFLAPKGMFEKIPMAENIKKYLKLGHDIPSL
ncbi:MAG: hypothetical protein V4580_11280 [Bacteroidota bacterium]